MQKFVSDNRRHAQKAFGKSERRIYLHINQWKSAARRNGAGSQQRFVDCKSVGCFAAAG
jgi:hypothetical protein